MTEPKEMKPMQQVYAHMAYELIAETLLEQSAEWWEGVADHIKFELPDIERVIISYGWFDDKNTRGVCIHGPGTVKDKDAVIFIRPDDWTDPETMLFVLAHEMIHAGLEPDDDNLNHTGAYTAVSQACGMLEGGTKATAWLMTFLSELGEQLPEFPAAPLEGQEPRGAVVVVQIPNSPNPPPEPKKQKNRSRRWMCDCGVIVRCASDDLRALCEKCGTTFKHRPAGSE